jgi:hypothetical protein
LFAGIVALADQAAGKPFGFLNPKLYALAGNGSAITDVGPAGKAGPGPGRLRQLARRHSGAAVLEPDHRLPGPETFCPETGPCSTRNVVISAVKGYDDMTGLGAPGSGFVHALSGPYPRPQPARFSGRPSSPGDGRPSA